MENQMEYHPRKMTPEELLELMEEDYEEMEREDTEYVLSQKCIEAKEVA